MGLGHREGESGDGRRPRWKVGVEVTPSAMLKDKTHKARGLQVSLKDGAQCPAQWPGHYSLGNTASAGCAG